MLTTEQRLRATTDPTTSALIRAALALAGSFEDCDWAGSYRHLVKGVMAAAAAYRAAHPEAGRDGDG